MKRRSIILLAIVAAALAVVIAIENRRGPAGDAGRAIARARVLPPFDRKTVRYITIHRYAAGQAYSMLHVPSPTAPPPAPGWQIEVPNAPAADDAAIDDLLAAADLAESDRSPDLSPEQAGLKPPIAELALETPTGAIALQLGRADPSGRGVYARLGPDGPMLVVGRRVFDLVDREPGAFRDRRLFPVEAGAVTAIAWRGPDGAGELRAVGGRWQNGRDEWVAGERAADSLRRLLALRVDKFEAGFEGKPVGGRTLTVTAGAARVAVDVGAGGEITRDGERLRVPEDALEAAWRSLAPAAARDDRLVAQAPDAITRVELAEDRARVVLARRHGEWSFESPKVAYGADTRAVDDWLGRLGAVKAATKPGGPHARHLSVEGRFREEAEVSAPPDVYALLAPDPLRFRDRALLSFARFDVRTATRTVGTSVFKASTDDGGTSWSSRDRVADPAKLAAVVAALSDLRAEEFVPAAPAGPPAVRWEIGVQAPGEKRPTNHVIDVHRRGDACVARVDRDPVTARLAAATCELLLGDPLKPAN